MNSRLATLSSCSIPLLLLSLVLFAPSSGWAGDCDHFDTLKDGKHNAANQIQKCIDLPTTTTLSLPAGKYVINHQIIVKKPLQLQTKGIAATATRCNYLGDDRCAVLIAHESLVDLGGVLVVQSDDVHIRHVVVDGNRDDRNAAVRQCRTTNKMYNITMKCSRCSYKKSVSKNAVCGTGLELNSVDVAERTQVSIVESTFARNGLHQSRQWADGLTIHSAADSEFVDNAFRDNADVDFIVGHCRNCKVQGNDIKHLLGIDRGSFAGLLIGHVFGADGFHTGSDISGNTIDCGANKACGFGLYVGINAWNNLSPSLITGGRIHHNVIKNVQQGIAIDGLNAPEITTLYANKVSATARSTNTDHPKICGDPKKTSHFSIHPNATTVDISGDAIGESYIKDSWVGCIPNAPQ